MLEIKMILAVGIASGILGVVALVAKLQEILIAIKNLSADISVIRLDNMRTMADIRRRNK